MKKRLALIMLISMVSLVLVYAKFFSHHPQKTSNKNELKKTDKNENNENIEIISNTSKGLWEGNKPIKLVEDLSIGKEDGDESEIFEYIYDITIDGNDNIYVIDSYAHTIKVYNSQGKFIRKIGRKGKGPGEFVTMNDIHWCEFDNLLYVVDRKNNRISQFSLDGTYLKGIKMNKLKMRVEMISSFENGYFVLAGRMVGRNKVDQKIIVVDHSFENILSEIQGDFPVHSVGMEVTPNFSDIGVINGNQFYYTSPSEYEIVITDMNLVKKKIIRKSSPKMFPAQYVKGFYTAFNSIGPIRKIQDIYVVDIWSTKEKNIPLFNKKRDLQKFCKRLSYNEQIDLFNNDFKFLTSISLPSNRYFADVDNQNRLYFIETDPFPRIIRCKLLVE